MELVEAVRGLATDVVITSGGYRGGARCTTKVHDDEFRREQRICRGCVAEFVKLAILRCSTTCGWSRSVR